MAVRRIGIMGGTFSPVHNGHLMLAQGAYDEYRLDKVIFLPNKIPPHKQMFSILEEYHRANMVHLAIRDNPAFEFSDAELKRPGFSYTSETLRLFCEKDPEASFYFIVGADSLNYMEEWHEAGEIFRMATILAAPRNESSLNDLDRKIGYLADRFGARIFKLHLPNIQISSRWIREAISRGQSIRYFVPDAVYEYIKENRLYGISVC